MWGSRRGCGWSVWAVERVRGVQQGALLMKHQREREEYGCCKEYKYRTKIFAYSSSLSLQTQRTRKRRECYSSISTREVRGCCRGQSGGLGEILMEFINWRWIW
jgi:hypothetical protein